MFSQNEKQKKITLSDKEIVDQIVRETNKEQQRRLQGELYSRYSGKIYHKCLSLTKDKEVAKDLTHDIIVKILVNLSNYKGTAPFYSWVFAIVYNQCMDYLKNQKKLRFNELDEQIGLADDNLEIQQKELLELQLNQLEELLHNLDASERMLLLMRYQDKLSIAEIANILQLSNSAVKMRLKRSRDHLATILKKENHG